MNISHEIIKKINLYFAQKKKKELDATNRVLTNWAIIGLGTMANKFAQALNVTPGARIIAAASRDISKANVFSSRYNIPNAFGSYTALLEDNNIKIDIVYISTPVFCHYENIKNSLLHNKNVLCEKPIVMIPDQLSELQELARNKGLFLAEGMWMFFLPTFKKADQWILDGLIGEIQGIRVDLSKQVKKSYTKEKIVSAAEEGCLYDYGIYPISFAMHYMKHSPEIDCFMKLTHESGFDNNWTILLRDGGVVATITISSAFEGCKKAVIFGKKGCIVWNSQFNRTNTITCFDSSGNIVDTFNREYIIDGFEYEITEIQTNLREGKIESDSVPLKTSLSVLKVMNSLSG